MRIAILLADIGKAIVREMDGLQPVRVHIALVLLPQDQAEDSALRVGIVHAEQVLLTVQRHDGQLIRMGSKDDARNVILALRRHLQLLDVACRHAVGMHGHLGVLLARFRIFIGIVSGIQPIALIHLHGVFRHLALV